MGTSAGEVKGEEKTVGGIGAVEDDLTLRAALYGVLFQSFADKVLCFASLIVDRKLSVNNTLMTKIFYQR